MPLAYPGKAITEGAVYSLIPDTLNPTGDQQFARLPDPNITNSTWYAIASNAHARGSAPPILEAFLNTFFSAMYPKSQVSPPIPTVQSMFLEGEHTTDDDVIVTVASQTYHAIPGQTRTFPGLAHAPLPGLGPAIKFLYPYSCTYDNVTHSAAVNQQVACWLGYQFNCPSVLTADIVAQTDNSLSQSTESQSTGALEGKNLFAANERLTATMPDHAVELAQPVQIPLNLTDGNVASITVNQHSAERSFTNQSASVAVGEGEAKVVQDDGLIKTVEVTPLQVGTVDVEVQVLFADGGISHQSYQLNVVPSSKGVRKFYLNQGFPALPIVLEDKDEDRQAWLSPEVYYDQLDYPIYLTDSTQIKFTVEQPGDPIISVDSNGLVHGLRPGRATITGDFDGVQDSVVVDVYTKEEAPVGYRRVHDNTNP
jgi:hypothetical protein